ncbi:Virulence-associated protein [Pseudomonas sp. 34 E 7]|uniref:type II toxin-antitoxin system VapB family antitoxin n=1 Tax=Pseudomonas sp. 34 E 7 TaxID=1844102 RepID=UPI0008126848|nr:type II toxin-antitoxin system VapB family antitoxin [Pseudomonas sp. 34 E 7]CRN00697.1 Virulence-associated protein [Pseudomonas sp. 34 E 7]CRN00786.1 Virulence-associated protein [Pseudomonas sp. 34 E 7]CRN00874.1 Virulence-associated protein [Pseudomonas sp. 34 E 7]
MRTVSIIGSGEGQTIHLPADMTYDGVDELEILREGDTIILRPVRPSWLSLVDLPKVDEVFLQERKDVIERVKPNSGA